MIKKVYISESEKKQIISLHKFLSEETTFSVSGIVLSKDKQEPVVNARVVLMKDAVSVGGVNTDLDGKFTIQNVAKGDYKLSVTDSSKVYESFEENISIVGNKTDERIYLNKVKELEQVIVLEVNLTMLDFYFYDYNDAPLNVVNIELSDESGSWKQELRTYNGKISVSFDSSGNIINNTNPVEVDKSIKNELFSTDGKACDVFKKLDVKVKAEGEKKQTKQIEYCIKNASYKASTTNKGGDIVVRTPDPENPPKRNDSFQNSNIFKITYKKEFDANFKFVNSEDKPISGVRVNFYSDADYNNLVGSSDTNSEGVVEFKKSGKDLVKTFSEIDNKIKVYIQTTSKGYKPFSGSKNIESNKIENIKIKLNPLKEPKPAKPMSFRQCKKQIRDYYNNYIQTIKKGKTIEDAGGEQFIMDSREQVKWCYISFQKKYSERYQKAVRRLRNTATNYDAFEINFTIQQQQDIYKENYNMSLSNSIRKVIFEQSEVRKSIRTEKKIINNRLFFVLENSNRRNLKNNLLSESKKLIKNGYNKQFVKESFMDIMTGMKDPKTFLTDIKNQLGKKIADTVKDKQQEHELILGAFNELDPSVVERAFKENKTDELAEIISTKALENYKTQFGDSGLIGSLFASVDTNKFKTEVSKLLQTAINQMNTEMTQKVEKSVSDEEAD